MTVDLRINDEKNLVIEGDRLLMCRIIGTFNCTQLFRVSLVVFKFPLVRHPNFLSSVTRWEGRGKKQEK